MPQNGMGTGRRTKTSCFSCPSRCKVRLFIGLGLTSRSLDAFQTNRYCRKHHRGSGNYLTIETANLRRGRGRYRRDFTGKCYLRVGIRRAIAVIDALAARGGSRYGGWTGFDGRHRHGSNYGAGACRYR